MNDFGSTYRRAISAQANARATFNREFPNGEGCTLGTVGESIDQLDAFLAKIGFLIASGGVYRLAAPQPDPRSQANLLVITEPLRNATAKYQLAQRIMANLNGLNCKLPRETVNCLGKAIEQAIELAEQL